MINTVMGYFEITKYKDEQEMMIGNLLETTWITSYTCPTEIMYDRGSELIGYGSKKSIIQEEYGIKANPITSGNITSNGILERIHPVLGNLVQT